jgi:hypothetical protein
MVAKYYLKIRGEDYELNRAGWIKRLDMTFTPSANWRVAGIKERWNQRLFTPWAEMRAKLDQGMPIEGYLMDIDHGSLREWGGSYNGHLPKAYIHPESGKFMDSEWSTPEPALKDKTSCKAKSSAKKNLSCKTSLPFTLGGLK